jgi:hypothetical protein
LWEIRIQTIQWDNTGSLYTSTPTHEGNTTIQPDVHRTNPLMSISWTNIDLSVSTDFDHVVKFCIQHDVDGLCQSFVEMNLHT